MERNPLTCNLMDVLTSNNAIDRDVVWLHIIFLASNYVFHCVKSSQNNYYVWRHRRTTAQYKRARANYVISLILYWACIVCTEYCSTAG